jgi:endonuclease YncB( thermonuclease family)
MRNRSLPVLGLTLLAVASPAAEAAETLPGPIPARLVEVIDGDTLRVRARIWLGQEIETAVRLAGVNAPELAGKCDSERRLARTARASLAQALGGGDLVLTDVTWDKYGGRVVATVRTPSGDDPTAALLAEGLARPYGGGRREGWCG